MWQVIDFVVVAVLIWAIVFQMIIPTFYNLKMWPMFRKEAKLKDELIALNCLERLITALNTEEVTNELEGKVAKRKKAVRSKKPK